MRMSTAGVSRNPPGDVEAYRAWVRRFDPWDGTIIAPGRARYASLPRHPLLTVVMLPDGVTPSRAARQSIESVLRQSYPHWEAWTQPQLPVDWDDERVRPLERRLAASCAEWFNEVVHAAEGEYVVPVPPYALLAPHALLEVAAAITSSSDEADLLYSDEDALDGSGLRMAPRFKPGWDVELMLGRNVVGNLAAYRTTRVTAVGGADPGLGSGEEFLYDLSLRTAASLDSGGTRHIPLVLCSTPWEAVQAREVGGASGRKVVAAHLERCGRTSVSVVAVPDAPAWNRIIWSIQEPPPLVSVIVPTRDQPQLLSRCVEGVLNRTDYRNLELLIVDNGSVDPEALGVMRRVVSDQRVRVLQHDAPFNFSSLVNHAARKASGSVLVLLNDDTEVVGGDWLRELVSQALRPEIGVVGAKLLYPTGQIQHAGIVMESGKPHHQFRLCDASELGPNGELALTRSVSAVTAACMAIRKSLFDDLGGLDENLGVAFGDVDLCLRATARGFRVICTPFAELYHLESASRGYEDTPDKQSRQARELRTLRDRWGPQLMTDPFANPNLAFGWDERGAWGLPGSVPASEGSRRRLEARNARFASAVHRTRLLRWVAAHLVPNPLFSAEWYLASYPEVASYRLGPYQHYRRHGVRDGRDPNPLFDTYWYLERNPDVAARGMNPLDHYLHHGAAEGRDPSPRFSTERYLSAHPQVRASGENPLLHHLLYG